MRFYILALFFMAASCISVANAQSSGVISSAPASDLGHIDVILDSATYFAIKNNSFLKNEFGVVEVDTLFYGGKPSYDLYILGQLNFLHLSLAKGYWNNQAGGGVMVFQTQKPGMIEPLLAGWKRYFTDSLFVHTYKGSDFTLDEAMAWYPKDSTKLKNPYIFANLTSYSKDSYQNWGITDSIIDAGQSMKVFMDGWGGEAIKDKLFHSITELHVTSNSKEYKELRSALLATGYEERQERFIHTHNPTVYLTRSEAKGVPKYSKVGIRLSRAVARQDIIFSPTARLSLDGQKAWFLFR